MDESLLDTDILNEVLKQKHANVVRHAADISRSTASSRSRPLAATKCCAD